MLFGDSVLFEQILEGNVLLSPDLEIVQATFGDEKAVWFLSVVEKVKEKFQVSQIEAESRIVANSTVTKKLQK